MNRNLILIPVLNLAIFSWAAHANDDSAAHVCKLTIRTKFKDPARRKKLEIQEVPVASREECQALANEKKLNNDEAVDSVAASFSFWKKNR